VTPRGIEKLMTRAGAVPVICAEAGVVGGTVVTVPTLNPSAAATA
jgi:hypothetical protein